MAADSGFFILCHSGLELLGLGLLVDSRPKARTFNAQIPVHCASLDSWTASIAGLPLSNPTMTSTGVFPSAVGCLVIVSYIHRAKHWLTRVRPSTPSSSPSRIQRPPVTTTYDGRPGQAAGPIPAYFRYLNFQGLWEGRKCGQDQSITARRS